MNSSELKHKIRIERYTTEKNSTGIPIERWTLLCEPRSKVEFRSGSETNKNEGVQNTLQLICTVRYNPNNIIKDTDRFVFDNKTFNISCVENVDYKNRWLRITGIYIK